MPKIKIQDSPERSPSPVAKRPRAALNFSIESIMRPSECKTFNQHDSTPSPSSSTSSLSRGSSQNSPPISPGVHDNLSQHAEHHRASTSIASPPCHLVRTKTTKSAAVASTKTALDLFECRLDNLDLWHRFHPLGTEMIITKQGRRMFPPVRVTFSLNDQLLHHHHQQATGCNQQQQLQLNPRDKYQVLMDIRPYDKKRYRYAYHKSSWQAAGKSDPPSPTKLFLHPDGPFTLDQLKRQVISFEKIKLTNSDGNKHGYIVLNSMHKYQPRIHLILWRGKESQNLANAPVALLEHEVHKTFIFSETIFTAVTAYQNHSITKLKIDSNPFAKGFRDSTRLTDLELESMHDLIADGQCPFSPPRAPPPGFPHFLFAATAAQQSPHYNNGLHQHHHPHQAFGTGLPPPPPPYQFLEQPPGGAPANHIGRPNSNQTGEDAAAALLRERTIMALDSFLQQQQQQQQSSSSVSPHQLTAASKRGATSSPNSLAEQLRSGSSETTNGNNCNQSNKSASAIPPPPTSNQSFNPAFGSAFAISGPPQPPPHLLGPVPPPPTSQSAAAISQNQLEQFIMQQQQFAAAMAAAAASGVHNQAHHNQHSAYQLQSLFAQVVQQQKCQQGPPVGSTTPTSQQQALGELDSSSPPASRQMAPAAINTNPQQQQHQEQTSPIGLAKSANRQLQLDLNQFLGHHNKNNHHLHQIPITSTAGGNTAHHINQQHTIQAIMQQQQQMQQMAALAQSQTNNNHLNHLNHLQMEPLLGLHEAGLVSRRATKNK